MLTSYKKTLLAFGAISALFTATAVAQHGPRPHRLPRPPIFDACKTDIKSLCGNSARHPFAIEECLDENADALSESCKAAKEKMDSDREAFEAQIELVEQACQAELEANCSKAFGPRRWWCLNRNESKLSEACKSEKQRLDSLRDQIFNNAKSESSPNSEDEDIVTIPSDDTNTTTE